jgi:hypothetical protein
LLDIASAKLIGRIIAPENVTADDFRMVADATGFKGKAEDFANWWAGEGVKNPQTVVNAIQAANHIISGQYNAYKSGLEGTRSRYAQYGANPARVGDELPLVHITTLEEARKRQAELLAKQAAGKDASSPESMATWLAGLR